MRAGSPRDKTLVGICRCGAYASLARAKVRGLIEGLGIFLSDAELHAFFTVKPTSRPAARIVTSSSAGDLVAPGLIPPLRPQQAMGLTR